MAKRKTRLPKRIGGYKIPRALRRSSTVGFFVEHPLGREILAEAVVAAAGAAAAAIVKYHPSAARIGEAGTMALHEAGRAADRTADTIEDALGALGGRCARRSHRWHRGAGALPPAANDPENARTGTPGNEMRRSAAMPVDASATAVSIRRTHRN